MVDRKDFRRWCRFLRREFPSCYPVRVRLIKPGGKGMPIDQSGETHVFAEGLKLKKFEILIRETDNWQVMQDTLFEEWAHMLRFHIWGVKGERSYEEHDAIYGAIYNTIKAKWHD